MSIAGNKAKCAKGIQDIYDDMDLDNFILDEQIYGAVEGVIGSPSKGEINDLEEEISTARGRKGQRARSNLKIAQIKYKAHVELFDFLKDYIARTMEIARESSSSNFIPNPRDIAEQWREYFGEERFGIGVVNPITVQEGSRRLVSMLTRAKKVAKQREVIYKRWEKGGVRARIDVALMRPGHIAMKVDRFGILMKPIQKLQRVSDAARQMQQKFLSTFEVSNKNFMATINELVKNGSGVVNLNSFFYSGIEAHGVEGTKVLILGEEKRKGVKHYKVKKWIADLDEDSREYQTESKYGGWSTKEYFMPVDTLDVPYSTVIAALKKQILYEFTNDLLAGQTRLIIPIAPPKGELVMDPQGHRQMTEDRKNWHQVDGKELVEKLGDLKNTRMWNLQNPDKKPRATPGVFTHTIGTTTYYWTMVKQGEVTGKKLNRSTADTQSKFGNNAESYHAYIISEHRAGEKPRDIHVPKDNETGELRTYDIALMEEILGKGDREKGKAGFFKADKEVNFGRYLVRPDSNTKMVDIPNIGMTPKIIEQSKTGKYMRDYVEYQSVKVPTQLMSGKLKGTEKVSYGSLWDTINAHRGVWFDVASDMNKRITKNENDYKKMFQQWVADRKGQPFEEVSAAFDEFLSSNDIRQRAWLVENEEGNADIRMVAGTFLAKEENYMPHLYKPADLYSMINNSIVKLKQQMDNEASENGMDTKQYKEWKEAYEHMVMMKNTLSDRTIEGEEQAKLVANERTVRAKHFSAWTDATLRRKDEMVSPDSLNSAYSNIARNDVTIDVLEALHKLKQVEGMIPKGVEEYLMNRALISFHDPRARGTNPITGNDYGYTKVAEMMNRLPKWVRLGRTFDAESAGKIVKSLTAFPSMRFLGWSSAVGNRTQILNNIIEVGWRITGMAKREQSESPEMWQEIVDHTGVLNILDTFADIMAHGEKPGIWDMGFFPGTIIPTRRLVDIRTLLNRGRDKFVEDDNVDIDNILIGIQERSHGKTVWDIEEVRDLYKESARLSNDIKEKKGALYDLFTMEEHENNLKNIRTRIKSLMPGIAEDRLKMLVTWKLGWWMDSEGKGMGKSLFTFSESEKSLRAESVVIALIVAREKGLLGEGDKDDISMYKTDAAVKIARDMVYATQFGMTPTYLGEAFEGMGRAIWQFKQYSTQQIMHDHRITRRFREGNIGMMGSTSRLIKAQVQAFDTLRKTNKHYDPSDPFLDHDALAVVRLLYTRVAVSLLASIVSVAPIITKLIGIGGMRGLSQLRSAENPVFGFAARVMVWLWMGIAGSDREEEKFKDVVMSWRVLFLPVVLGALLKDLFATAEVLSELD